MRTIDIFFRGERTIGTLSREKGECKKIEKFYVRIFTFGKVSKIENNDGGLVFYYGSKDSIEQAKEELNLFKDCLEGSGKNLKEGFGYLINYSKENYSVEIFN